MRGARMMGQNIDDRLAVPDAAGIDLVAEHKLLPAVVNAGREHELSTAPGLLDTPSGECARDLLDILLR